MSASTDPRMDCQCGETDARAPLDVASRPGLSALAYRIGTQPQFKGSMLARLGAVSGLLHGNRGGGDGQ